MKTCPVCNAKVEGERGLENHTHPMALSIVNQQQSHYAYFSQKAHRRLHQFLKDHRMGYEGLHSAIWDAWWSAKEGSAEEDYWRGLRHFLEDWRGVDLGVDLRQALILRALKGG